MLVLHTMDTVKRFLLAETGQDLVEYALLLVFVMLVTVGYMQQTATSVTPIWTAGSTTIQTAADQIR